MSLSDKDKSAVKALWAKVGPKADEIGAEALDYLLTGLSKSNCIKMPKHCKIIGFKFNTISAKYDFDRFLQKYEKFSTVSCFQKSFKKAEKGGL
uniref:Globin family profile domain-containing protein n=1 Tax=Sinocyclocheilus rhinocerous TaxID=307959 RepID=A0A673M929_9TELE